MRHGAAVPGRPSPRRVRGRLTHSSPGPVAVSRSALLALLALTLSRPISSLARSCLYGRPPSLSDGIAPTSPCLRHTASAGCKLNVIYVGGRDSRPTGSNDATRASANTRPFLHSRSFASGRARTLVLMCAMDVF